MPFPHKTSPPHLARGATLAVAVLALAFLAALCGAALAQDPPPSPPPPPSLHTPVNGQEVYNRACLACHGPAGTGQPQEQLGFKVPVPQFTDCKFATREPDSDWVDVVSKGGPARAFNRMMPAFGSILSREEIIAALDYMRAFCKDKSWPRGELNLPLALYTTKAFPEDEVVVKGFYDTSDNNKLDFKVSYEQRIGARGMFEVTAPYGWHQMDDGQGGKEWQDGLGDVAVAGKYVLYASLETGAIFSVGSELVLPTGDENKGFGNGTTVLEPYLAYGQILPANFFLQGQLGGALPYDGAKANEEVFGRMVFGRLFHTGYWGRMWAPMVEFLAAQELVDNAASEWDVVPQFQVTLSRRHHVRLGLGARIPLTQTDTRDVTYGAYLLWDWYDGGLFEGW